MILPELKKVVLTAVTMIFVSFVVHAEIQTSGASFLLVGVGARAIGMGEAFTAVNGDADGAYWNPAGLAGREKSSASLMYLKWISDYHFEHISYIQPFTFGTLGGSIEFMHAPNIVELDELGNETGKTLATNNLAGTLSFAKDFGDLSVGINGKIIRRTLAEYVALAYAIDMGMMYEMEVPCLYKNMEKNLCIGLVMQNVGTKIRFIEAEDPLPITFKTGISYAIWRDRINDVRIAFDLYQPFNNVYCVGVEYRLFEMFEARVGYKYALKTNTSWDYINGLRAGFGVKIREYRVDFAFAPHSDLGNSYFVSASMEFGRTREEMIQEMKRETRERFKKQINEGNYYIENRMFRKALEEYQKAMEIIPGETEAIRAIAEAENSLKNEFNVNYVFAMEKLKKKDFYSAEADFKKTIEICRDTELVGEKARDVERKLEFLGNYNRAQLYYNAGDYENAEALFEKAVAADSTIEEAKIYLQKCKTGKMAKQYFDHGVQMYLTGKYDMAVADFKAYIECGGEDQKNKNEAERLIKTANIYLIAEKRYAENELKDAVKMWKSVLEMSPDDTDAKNKITAVYEQVRQYFDKGRQYFLSDNYDSAILELTEYMSWGTDDTYSNMLSDKMLNSANMYVSARKKYTEDEIKTMIDRATEYVNAMGEIDTLVVSEQYSTAKDKISTIIAELKSIMSALPNKYFEKKLEIAEQYDKIIGAFISAEEKKSQRNYDDAIKELESVMTIQPDNSAIKEKIEKVIENIKLLK